MNAAFGLMASVALGSVPANEAQDIDDDAMRFANTLITAYSCDLLGYDVNYIGLVDRGHEIREAIMDGGATYDEATERLQGKVRSVRGRFNRRYRSAIFAGGETRGRFWKSFAKKCNALADSEETAEFFKKPKRRLSYAEFRRKIGDLRVLALSED